MMDGACQQCYILTNMYTVLPAIATLPRSMPRSFHPVPFVQSMTIAFFSKARTVSEGWAPTASHFLMAGALRLVSFRSGSYQPRFCTSHTYSQ
jgi:hypothetical protein